MYERMEQVVAMEEKDVTEPSAPAEFGEALSVVALEHMTGPCRGTVTWLWQPEVYLRLGPYGHMHITEGPMNEAREGWVARICRDGNGFNISAVDDQPLWINRKQVDSKVLEHHDTIEFGNNGPMSRCYLYDNQHPMRETVTDIIGDTLAYFRNSRQPFFNRLMRSAGQLARRLAGETTLLFRFSVIVALAFLGWFTYQQGRIDTLLTQQVESGAAELEAFSSRLTRAREEALTPEDLTALSSELRDELATTAERVTDIERRSEASANVIADAMPSVLFLQGSWGFREKDGERMLRIVVDENGNPLPTASGVPRLSLDGTGPVAERQFTGTGFMVGDNGALVTNRHVGLPWEYDANVKMMLTGNLEPIMTRFIAYVPGVPDSIPVEFVAGSDDADVAILRQTETVLQIKGLRLAGAPPDPGEEIIVMGYPTGLRSMLAQAGERFLEDLRKTGETGFWSVAERLALSGRILPLASRGIVGGTSGETIAYDAETTHGGSGGPVLDINGEVVAVNAAILPEYGGSNLGVPVAKVRELLERAKMN
ncbi:S1 family peptidase [Hoeflea prorocentri]|uniref:Serine protease n=1 Tax=Hoeflea prorocentri TaxID=1922333 RepID=A0A9X3UF29_9HYPH|nr:serine protease [Hoeflea prorocentri]MCY6379449.1 serine protease [Hoeflea prorocentri]MDA5397249.1 serine protease [Hoeflea prorocentri]